MSFCNLDDLWDSPTESDNLPENHNEEVPISETNDYLLLNEENCNTNGETNSNNTNGDVIKDSNSAAKKKKQNRRSKYPLLPPCRICGDKSSGFHYGATTCEACKVGTLSFRTIFF